MFSLLGPSDTFPGLVGQIKDKDHLSPAEAEAGAELGNILLGGVKV